MPSHLDLDIYLTVCTLRDDHGVVGKIFLWYQVQNFMNTENESLIDFPCDFPIKVIGKSDSDIDEHVVGILLKWYNFNQLGLNVKYTLVCYKGRLG